jgi:hypothetical protein
LQQSLNNDAESRCVLDVFFWHDNKALVIVELLWSHMHVYSILVNNAGKLVKALFIKDNGHVRDVIDVKSYLFALPPSEPVSLNIDLSNSDAVSRQAESHVARQRQI